MVDNLKVEEFMELTIKEVGAALNSFLVVIGDKLGLYKAMSKIGPITAAELASLTGTNERYIREWLAVQVCSGYVKYDPVSSRYMLPQEHALVLAHESSPYFMMGAFQHLIAATKIEDKLFSAFKTGEGIDWSEHGKDVFEGQERFSRPAYESELVSKWIPSLEGGVLEKLNRGAKVADIGCGFGISTVIMAKAFPNSKFFGFDYHYSSVGEANRRATTLGIQNASFEAASSTDFPGSDYELITFFDSLHDMGDPEKAARHARQALKPDGTCMIVEVASNENLEENINPLGRALYAASIFLCLPASLAQAGPGLGLVNGELRFRKIVERSGFSRFRKATQGPFHMVLEARP